MDKGIIEKLDKAEAYRHCIDCGYLFVENFHKHYLHVGKVLDETKLNEYNISSE